MKKIITLIIILFAISHFAFSQNNELKQLKKEYELLKEQTQKQEEFMQQQYDFLKTQTTEYKDFIEKERKQHQTFLEWTYGVSGGIIALLLGVLSFWGYRTRKDMQDAAQREINAAVNQVKGEITQRVNSAIDELVISDIQNLKSKSTILTQQINQLVTFLNSRITIINKNDNYNELYVETKKWLVKKGFKQEYLAFTDKYNNELTDFIVYFYNPTAKDEEGKDLDPAFSKLLESLQGKNIPLIVYHSRFVNKTEKKELDNYGWGYPANSPLSLFTNILKIAEVIYFG